MHTYNLYFYGKIPEEQIRLFDDHYKIILVISS